MKTAFKQKDGSVKWVGCQDLPGIKVDKEIEDFNDTVSPLYKKGNYDFYTIKLN